MTTTDTSLPATVKDLPTPCFIVDLNVVKNNCQTMVEKCKKLGLQLRPHQKTHKTIEGGKLMTGGTCRGIVVSTLQEAEFFADHGFDDILYGYPIQAVKLHRCKEIMKKCSEFLVMYDSKDGVDALERNPPESGKKWCVLLEIDAGDNRTGLLWDDQSLILELAESALKSPVIDFRGLYLHDGTSYEARSIETIQKIGERETDRLLSVVKMLSDHGITCEIIGTGSTPTCSRPSENMQHLTEFHPGNYIFYDYMQYRIGSCRMEDIACRVATRVISHKPKLNQFSVDCGFTGLSHDGLAAKLSTGAWIIQDQPDLKVLSVTQEIGTITSTNGTINFDKYPVGTMLFLYPYHACATAAMHSKYYIHSDGNIVDVWKPTRGW